MKWRDFRVFAFSDCNRIYQLHRFRFATFLRKVQPAQARVSAGGARNGSSSQGNFLLVPGATVATILMLGALHARRLYDDKMIEEAREKGVELEFRPDAKARFLRLLPLRSISRFWGSLTSMELPIWLRPYVYKAWARAFHSKLEEVQLPLEEYASLKDFFVRMLKEGLRPIDSDPYCLVSPVDGTVMRFGELTGPGAMIEQVKGFSYSASSLIGANSHLPMLAAEDINQENGEECIERVEKRKSWWRVSLASPKVRNMSSFLPMKGLFYCVIYLNPGDYHRIHSPVDWNILVRRHFKGNLFPVNERAARTIRNLYVENERVILIHTDLASAPKFDFLILRPAGPGSKFLPIVPHDILAESISEYRMLAYRFMVKEKKILVGVETYLQNPFSEQDNIPREAQQTQSKSLTKQLYHHVVLEGQWREGYMAMAAVGATNIGSIELFIEPRLRTNHPHNKLLHSEPPDERLYEPEGMGVTLKKGDELAAFNMGSTVVLVFQAPNSQYSTDRDCSSDFKFCVKRGDRIHMGEALGRWRDEKRSRNQN